MGEFATYCGEQVKIGTCENMYYLRADQARLVTPERGSVDPLRNASQIRFRFPFPDEDNVKPGDFEDYERRIRLDGIRAPASLADEHYGVQFLSSHGYNANLPCPESIQDAPTGLGAITIAERVHVHRNGFKGATFLVQQRLVDGQLVPILQCVCGMSWRVTTIEDCEEFLRALEEGHYSGGFSKAIARRVRRGFDREYVASLGFTGD